MTPTKRGRVAALVETACQLLQDGAGEVPGDQVHRLEKADTRSGIASIRHVAAEGVPYSMLLYERFMGRPFAGHRDSVSELVGDVMESAVEEQLWQAQGQPSFQVVACIDGRGFGVRRRDMRKLLIATHGRVFTLGTVGQLVEHTALKNFKTAR